MTRSRPLNLSEAVELLRNLSVGLHDQEVKLNHLIVNGAVFEFAPSLDQAWQEATAFIVSYDECQAALAVQEARQTETVKAMIQPREDKE